MDELSPLFIYVLPVLLALCVGLVGSTRRLGFVWALILAVILTPVGGFFVALISGPKPIRLKSDPNAATRKR